MISYETLRRMYGPKIVPTRETTTMTITTEDAQMCLAEVAPLTTPHKEVGGLSICLLFTWTRSAPLRSHQSSLLWQLAMSQIARAISCPLPPFVMLLKKTEE